MTIDERLEALTQSLELLTHESHDHFSKLDAAMTKLAEEQAKTEKVLRAFGRYAMLIARDHEGRIATLELGNEE